VAQQADSQNRRSIMTDGALLLFNLVITSYIEEAELLQAAANMMLYVIYMLEFFTTFFVTIKMLGTSQPMIKKQAVCSILVSS
jgi:hypothetical protein